MTAFSIIGPDEGGHYVYAIALATAQGFPYTKGFAAQRSAESEVRVDIDDVDQLVIDELF